MMTYAAQLRLCVFARDGGRVATERSVPIFRTILIRVYQRPKSSFLIRPVINKLQIQSEIAGP